MQTNEANALRLLDKILTNQHEVLSQEEADCLFKHKEICTRKLLPILAFEIAQIKESEPWTSSKLLGSLKLLAAFEEKKAFDWVLQLHDFPHTLEDETGYFVLLFWADILAATISSEWLKLTETIESLEMPDDIREACIDALVILVAEGRLERALVVEYFQTLYSKALSGEIYDPELLVFLLDASLVLWPGESIEEIRELFGLGLIDEHFVDLSELLITFEEGKEDCLARLKNWTSHSSLFDLFVKNPFSSEEEISSEEDSFEFETEAPDLEEESDADIENYPIYLLPSSEVEQLSPKEQKKYQSLPKLLLESPEKVIEIVSKMLEKNQNIPTLFYYYHSALILLDAKVLAMEVLKKWIEKFPNDLLGKIEYAYYLLRRAEPELVETLLSNTWSLSSLYPERESFHELECLKFFHLRGLYLLQIGEPEEVQYPLQVLDTINPHSFEYHHLKKKLAVHLQGDFFVEDL